MTVDHNMNMSSGHSILKLSELILLSIYIYERENTIELISQRWSVYVYQMRILEPENLGFMQNLIK